MLPEGSLAAMTWLSLSCTEQMDSIAHPWSQPVCADDQLFLSASLQALVSPLSRLQKTSHHVVLGFTPQFQIPTAEK